MPAATPIDSLSSDAPARIALAVLSLAADAGRGRPLTVVCVGTDRSTGDSLGPLVGSMLLKSSFPGSVIGNLDNPVHAENLGEAAARLEAREGLVLGVDACLGTRQEVGSVMVRPGPLRPGLGVKKKLTPIGDLYIAGVVNVGGFMEYMVLQNTRLSVVMKMAQAIASGLLKADAIMREARGGNPPEPVQRNEIPTRGVLANDGLLLPLLPASARQR